MQIDKNSCLQLLDEFGLTPSKDKGQNYLINPSTAKRIVDALMVEEGDKVIEIGPGLGSLTHYLEEKCDNLSVVDIDRRTCEILDDLYPGLVIFNGDALKAPLDNYDRIISNVPYSVTSELIEHILLGGKKLKQCVLMVQEDAYKRIVSLKGKDYGPLSVLIHLLGNVKPLFKVGANDFYPRPNCVSIVFSIDLNGKNLLSEKGYRLIKTLFTNRRKTLLNNLLLVTTKESATQLLSKLNLPLTVRPEEVNPETYYKLVSLILLKGQ